MWIYFLYLQFSSIYRRPSFITCKALRIFCHSQTNLNEMWHNGLNLSYIWKNMIFFTNQTQTDLSSNSTRARIVSILMKVVIYVLIRNNNDNNTIKAQFYMLHAMPILWKMFPKSAFFKTNIYSSCFNFLIQNFKYLSSYWNCSPFTLTEQI